MNFCRLIVFASIVVASLVISLTSTSLRAESPVVAPRPQMWWADDATVQRWIAELSSKDFQSREAALRNLANQPRTVLPQIKTALENAGPEGQERLLQLLDHYHRSGLAARVDASEEVLRSYLHSENPLLADGVREILDRNARISQERAVLEIRRLGGVVRFYEQNQTRSFVVINGRAVPVVSSPDEVEHIVLGAGWRGGDEGLKQVARLRSLSSAFIIEGSGVSQDAQNWLLSELPNLEIQNRGRAFVGITMLVQPNGCGIRQVTPKSAADRAGLRAGDVITRFDGNATPDPDTLINLIGKYQPGDRVRVDFQRNFRPSSVNMTLGTWDRPAP